MEEKEEEVKKNVKEEGEEAGEEEKGGRINQKGAELCILQSLLRNQTRAITTWNACWHHVDGFNK